MEATTLLRADAEPIGSTEWLTDFAERYLKAWNAHDHAAVAACVAEDVVWEDPGLPAPVHGRDEVADFVRAGVSAFPDLQFSEPGQRALSDDRRVVYAPWRMTGTNTGPIDPPGFAPTGKPIDLEGVDVWQFRGGLIWRYRAVYDFAEMGRQLGLMPGRGGFIETAMVRVQRLRSRLPF